jgi:hypothetical protein
LEKERMFVDGNMEDTKAYPLLGPGTARYQAHLLAGSHALHHSIMKRFANPGKLRGYLDDATAGETGYQLGFLSWAVEEAVKEEDARQGTEKGRREDE